MENKFSNPGILKTFRYDFLTFLWIVIIMGLTFTPGPSIPRLPQWRLISFDTFVHAFIFCVLVFLMTNAFKRSTMRRFLKKWPTVYAFLISILFGTIIELIQPYIPGRTFEYYDILSNSIGALFGVIAVFVQSRFFPLFEY